MRESCEAGLSRDGWGVDWVAGSRSTMGGSLKADLFWKLRVVGELWVLGEDGQGE